MIRYSKKLKEGIDRMKGLFKSVVTLSFITIVGVIAYFLLTAMKKMYLQSWFLLNRSVIIGFLSGLILTCLLSFANFIQAQRSHARERAVALDRFFAESAAFLNLARGFQAERGVFEIPQENQLALGAALARLAERASSLSLCERISPLPYSAIQRRGVFASPIARTERAFDQSFVAFEESCVAAYHTHSSLPYLTSEPERQAAQVELQRHLQQVMEQLNPQSALSKAQLDYRSRIDRFLGARPAEKASQA